MKTLHLSNRLLPRKTSIDITLTTRKSVDIVWYSLLSSLKVIGIMAIVASSARSLPLAVLIFSGFLLLM